MDPSLPVPTAPRLRRSHLAEAAAAVTFPSPAPLVPQAAASPFGEVPRQDVEDVHPRSCTFGKVAGCQKIVPEAGELLSALGAFKLLRLRESRSADVKT